MWYAEPPVCASCSSDPGKQSPSVPLSERLLGKHSKPECGGERRAKKANVQGMEKITKCSQPHRKADGPEQLTIKGKEDTVSPRQAEASCGSTLQPNGTIFKCWNIN